MNQKLHCTLCGAEHSSPAKCCPSCGNTEIRVSSDRWMLKTVVLDAAVSFASFGALVGFGLAVWYGWVEFTHNIRPNLLRDLTFAASLAIIVVPLCAIVSAVVGGLLGLFAFGADHLLRGSASRKSKNEP